MKYFRIFRNRDEYEEYVNSSDFVTPNVSYIMVGNVTSIVPEQRKYEEDYFTIASLEDDNTISINRSTGGGEVPSRTFSVSIDDGESWTDVTVPFEEGEYSLGTINSGEKMLIKQSDGAFSRDSGSYCNFSATKNFNVEGNIMSLLYGDNFSGQTNLSSFAFVFGGLFSGCTTLISAQNLRLPATTLCNDCYNSMFQGCSALTTVMSSLPAITLTEGCYRSMFDKCSSLTNGPVIHASNVPQNALRSMFCDCASLTTAPAISANTISYSGCTYMFCNCSSLISASDLSVTTIYKHGCAHMFDYCTSLVVAPKIPVTNIDMYGCAYMFRGCTSLTTPPPILPATTMASSCYEHMFEECTSLTATPELPATSLGGSCYYQMFSGCTALTATTTLPATTMTSACYQSMFFGCTSLTVAPSLPATTLAASCYRNMFRDCTSLVTPPSTLPATTLMESCYRDMFCHCYNMTTTPTIHAATLASNCCQGMFYQCSAITAAPILSAETLASNCYQSMFEFCNALATVPALPATTLENACYYAMFKDCKNITTAPDLLAETLVDNCYREMFRSASKVNSIKMTAKDISATKCLEWWTSGVANSGTFTKAKSMTVLPDGVNGIPTGWTVYNDISVDVTGVTISATAATVDKGDTYTLTASVLPNDADIQTVTWSTSDSSIATVTNGVVSGVSCGNATITVTTDDGGYTAQCAVSVEKHVTGVDINTYVASISSGGTYQLEATVSPNDACDKSVTWSSNAVSIASVDSNGLVSGVTPGSATVTVTTVDGNFSKNCAVTVTEPQHASAVTLNENSITIYTNNTQPLTATVLPEEAVDKSVTWSTSDSSIATVSQSGVVSGVASGSATITVTTVDGGYTAQCAVTVEEPTLQEIVIEGASSISAETCEYRAIGDNVEDVTSSATWSIIAGSQYATINSSNGQVTILNGANESSVTIKVEYSGLEATKTVTLTYVSGATSETETESTTDIGGNTTTVTTTVTEFEDGSSVEVSETVVTDAEGNVIGTTESNKNTNADGSYNGNTVNYDASGNPTDGTNVTGDTEGNVSTQSVEYDESGNTVVTGYDIDTSESESGKTFMSGGTNTEYYAFDLTHGFVLDFDFTIDFANQPPGQSDNHHNILTAKRASPEPWYGFQIRHSQTNNYIQLGTQFATGSNTNTTINPSSTTGSVGSYSLRIVYDPNSSGNKFVCTNMATGNEIYSSTGIFPDLEELKYLRITIGNATDGNGNPFRYSNITVQNFELKKLKNVANPTITCEDNEVTISCSTVGASVYYRLNLHGDYSAYTSSFMITADTVVQAYATYSGDTSDIIREDFVYELEKPVISFDGEFATITCPNTGVTIYYRLNESGSYSAYTTPIEITANTVVEAYSELGEYTSSVVKETCVISISVTSVTLSDNSITLNRAETYTLSATVLPNDATNKEVTWSSSDSNVVTVDSNGVVSSVASGSATITVTTVDGGFTAQCSVNVTNSYGYFTIRSLADSNTITLKNNGTGAVKNFSYSLDSGTTWTDFTLANNATQTIATINSGATIMMKGNNTTLGTDYNKGCNFRGNKNYEVEGNISSLLNNNDTDVEITGGTFHFAQMFSGDTHIISAEKLKILSTTLYTSSFNGSFRSCSNLQKAPDLSVPTTLAQETYSSMFEGCTSLSQPPSVLSATTAVLTSYKRMFCMNRNSKVTTQMTKSPLMIVNFGSLSSQNDMQMFCGNGSLTEIKCFWTNNSGTFGSLTNWVNYTADSGVTFYKRSTQTFANGVNGIKTGWTVIDDDITGN